MSGLMDCQTQKTVLQTGSGLRGRNEAIECCRLLCAVLVVFIHCRFPGFLGEGINCLAKVAVPFFFVVSGYFAWQVREKTLRKRFWSVVKLNFSAHLLYILWDSYQADVRGLSELVLWCLDKCSAYALSILLLLSKSPFRSHLWYLNAVILPYILVWLYVRWQEKEVCDYRPLYLVGVCLYILHVVLGSLASACGLDIPYHIYRNGLLFGLPMFILGLFLGEHHDRIIRIYRLSGNKLMGLIVLGAFLSLLQKGNGTGGDAGGSGDRSYCHCAPGGNDARAVQRIALPGRSNLYLRHIIHVHIRYPYDLERCVRPVSEELCSGPGRNCGKASVSAADCRDQPDHGDFVYGYENGAENVLEKRKADQVKMRFIPV